MKLASVRSLLALVGFVVCTPASAWAQDEEDRIDDPELRGVPLARERVTPSQPPAAPPPDTAPQAAAPAPDVAAETTEEDDFLQTEQRIRDPEVDGLPLRSELPEAPKEPESTSSETIPSGGGENVAGDGGGGGEEATVIEDPELAGKEVTKESDADLRTTFQLELHTRVGLDTDWDEQNQRENVIEGTQIANLDVNFRRSETLRFAVGLRGRYRFTRMQSDPGPDEKAETFELDVAPTAGYADVTVADGFHLRLGYQTIAMGRFDFFTGLNFLGVADLRDGPATMPGASEIAQPAVRADLDLATWLTLQAFYVPFHQPHLIAVYGSDYAILAPLDRNEDPVVRAFLDSQRKELRNLSASALEALSPEPDLSNPQAALRITARSSLLEVGLTAGLAKDHTPALYPNEDLQIAFDPTTDDPATPEEDEAAPYLGAALASEGGPIDIVYRRYYVLSIDAATSVGAVQLGVEATYLKDYTLYGVDPEKYGSLPVPEGGDVGHFGLRAEWVDADLQSAAEVFYQHAFDDPSNDPRTGAPRVWLGLENGRYLAGAAAALRFTPGGGKFSVEGMVMGIVGPSLILSPRLEYAIAQNLFVEFGAILIEGRGGDTIGDPNVTAGGIYDGTDQVFTGVRWMP